MFENIITYRLLVYISSARNVDQIIPVCIARTRNVGENIERSIYQFVTEEELQNMQKVSKNYVMGLVH